MTFQSSYLPYQDTHSFSSLVIDYLKGHELLANSYRYTPDIDGIQQALQDRNQYPIDRNLLVSVLEKQYASISKSQQLIDNIEALKSSHTFTICTAHQPNLLTGYLYFIYKILHAIKLSQELATKFPHLNFIPVYYMGSEDNDLDELGTFRYNREKYTWNAEGQKGAVGNMQTRGMKEVLNDLFQKLGPPGDYTDQLKELLTVAYLKHDTISAATQFLVNELFGKYGLIVINPDEHEFKKAFTGVLKDDLLNGVAERLVHLQGEHLSKHYKTQAFPRRVNQFYMMDGLRERIETDGTSWKVLNTNISFNQEELLQELHTYPERFSPNVVLRGVFQESILPNIAFIGGGAEVAYWLQLKSTFEHYHKFYPVLLLRQSVQWIPATVKERMIDLSLSLPDIFLSKTDLIKAYLNKSAPNELQMGEEKTKLEQIFKQLEQKAIALDPTLKATAGAALHKMTHQVEVIQLKMLRALKKKNAVDITRIEKVKDLLFPQEKLQERVENFIEYYPYYGAAWIDNLLDCIDPMRNEFLVVYE